jgi:hypothetical protein
MPPAAPPGWNADGVRQCRADLAAVLPEGPALRLRFGAATADASGALHAEAGCDVVLDIASARLLLDQLEGVLAALAAEARTR